MVALVELAVAVFRYLFLAWLYWFLFQVVRMAWNDLREEASAGGRSTISAAGHLTVLAPAPYRGKVFALGEYVSIGRDPQNHIVLPVATVSARHAVIVRRNGGYWIQDAGSTNGTRLNGRLVRKPARLRAGDKLVLGEAILEFMG
ncbi:MAG: FHA domain-containing protein [Moorellales bacterium]